MRKWPQTIDTMFWPFAMKAQAERMNCLHLDRDDKTPEAKLHGVKIEEIPVKNYHPLFCPVYVLDHRLHSAGSAGLPKWDARSRIGVYCGHSPFHAGNVALVFNPKTGLISPQYHVVFDDEFTTVPYMARSEVPPHWPELFKQSCELSTDEQFELTMDWLSDGAETTNVTEDKSDCSLVNSQSASPDRDVTCTRPTITSPFDILSDQPDAVPENDVDMHLSRAGPCAATIEHVNNNKIRRSPTFSLSSHDRPDTHRSKRVRFGAARTAVQFSSADERGSQLCESHDASPSSQSQLTMPRE